MQQIRSNFITIPGLVILFALAFIAAYLGMGFLFAVLVAVFLLCLVSRLWADNSLKKLDFEIDAAELCGFPGDELYFPVKISNNKFLPVIWLSAHLQIDDGACITSGDDAFFSWVMPYQKLSWTERVRAERRGVCTVSKLDLLSGDGFGLSELTVPRDLKYKIEAVIYPAIFSVDVSVLLRKLTELEASGKGYYTDPTLLKTVTPYTYGDSYKDLNWRILARGGELVVNKKEKLDALRMSIIIDIESYSHEEISDSPSSTSPSYYVDQESFEHALSLAASISDAAVCAGAVCSVIIPAYDKRPSEMVVPEERTAQSELLLRALAAVDYHGGPAKIPYARIEDEFHRLGQLFCITASADESRSRFDKLDALIWYISSANEYSDHVIPEQEILL